VKETNKKEKNKEKNTEIEVIKVCTKPIRRMTTESYANMKNSDKYATSEESFAGKTCKSTKQWTYS
jgi:dynactin complex subunit